MRRGGGGGCEEGEEGCKVRWGKGGVRGFGCVGGWISFVRGRVERDG